MARWKVTTMFTFVAATLFFGAFLMAMGTIAWMFLLYHDKMIAALQFEPIPHIPVYQIRIRRPRAVDAGRAAAVRVPNGAVTA
jgi:hypothetical protein|tara:strand:- start:4579 stop:4827 length:249 start_codon:yes stop_codon:yes gene_type:complete